MANDDQRQTKHENRSKLLIHSAAKFFSEAIQIVDSHFASSLIPGEQKLPFCQPRNPLKARGEMLNISSIKLLQRILREIFSFQGCRGWYPFYALIRRQRCIVYWTLRSIEYKFWLCGWPMMINDKQNMRIGRNFWFTVLRNLSLRPSRLLILISLLHASTVHRQCHVVDWMTILGMEVHAMTLRRFPRNVWIFWVSW